MKFYFSIFLFFITSLSFGRDIFIITHIPQKKNSAITVKELMIKNEFVPEEYISIVEKEEPCLKRTDTLLHYCLDENDEKFIHINSLAMKITIKGLRQQWKKARIKK